MSALLGGVAGAGTFAFGPLAATMEWCSFCNRCFGAQEVAERVDGASPTSALATDASW
jgi:hypothetical protein